MNTVVMIGLIGKAGTLATREGLHVPVVVRDARQVYGRVEVLVENGSEQVWVRMKRVTLDKFEARSKAMRDSDGYYESSPTGRYQLLRDGKVVLSNTTEGAIWHYLHQYHSYSVSHALAHEGYRIEPA